MAAITQLHWQRHCNQDEAQDGLCTAAPTAEINADQRASSLFADASYPDQTSVNAANDYATELIQPIVPAAVRGDDLRSVAGQDAEARRRATTCKYRPPVACSMTSSRLVPAPSH